MRIKLPPEKVKEILSKDLIIPDDFAKKFNTFSVKSLDRYLTYYYNVLEAIGGKEILLILDAIECITSIKQNRKKEYADS